jgi:hypothetical protein
MNGTLGYIQAIQAINKEPRHAFGKAYFAHPFQFGHAQFQRFDEVLHIHRILARLVQEELEIERLVMAICIGVIDSIIDLTMFCDFQQLLL